MIKYIRKYKLTIALTIFLFPFLLLIIGDNFSNCLSWKVKPLYTFGIPLKDALTLWTAIGGALSVLYNIHLSQKKFNQQSKQIAQQDLQIKLQFEEQISNRYVKALEMLSHQSHDIVIGAIYNLDAIARLKGFDSKDENTANNFTSPVIKQFIGLLNRSVSYESEYGELERSPFLSTEDTFLVLELLFDINKGLTRISNNNHIYLQCCDLQFYESRINDLRFSNVTIENLKIQYAQLNNIHFINCQFKNSVINNSKLNNVVFEHCNMLLTPIKVYKSKIHNCTIIEDIEKKTYSDIDESLLEYFIDCDEKPSITFASKKQKYILKS